MRIALLVSKGVLGTKIQRVLQDNGLPQVDVWSDALVTEATVELMLKNAELLIVDFDNHRDAAGLIMSHLRTRSGPRAIPLLLLTDAPDRTLIRRIAEIESAEILRKPFEDVRLLERVLRHGSSPTFAETVVLRKGRDPEETGAKAMQWSEEYRIGIDEIDDEHRSIIERFEKLYQLMRQGRGHEYYRDLANFLDEYVHVHLVHEEKLQEDIGYDERESHLRHHDDFRRQVRQIVANSDERIATNEDLVRINLFIGNWLRYHILVEDMKIGAFLKRREAKN